MDKLFDGGTNEAMLCVLFMLFLIYDRLKDKSK